MDDWPGNEYSLNEYSGLDAPSGDGLLYSNPSWSDLLMNFLGGAPNPMGGGAPRREALGNMFGTSNLGPLRQLSVNTNKALSFPEKALATIGQKAVPKQLGGTLGKVNSYLTLLMGGGSPFGGAGF